MMILAVYIGVAIALVVRLGFEAYLIAHLIVALPVGLLATWQNRRLFTRATHRYSRMAAHCVTVGFFWPVAAPLAISFRPRF